jgi:hypothetical protein
MWPFVGLQFGARTLTVTEVPSTDIAVPVLTIEDVSPGIHKGVITGSSDNTQNTLYIAPLPEGVSLQAIISELYGADWQKIGVTSGDGELLIIVEPGTYVGFVANTRQDDAAISMPVSFETTAVERSYAGLIYLQLEILPSGKIRIPGAEPTSALSSIKLSAHLADMGCRSALVELDDALAAIPGSFVKLGHNFGRGYWQRWYVLPPYDTGCPCDERVDYYTVLRGLACEEMEETESMDACDLMSMGHCPSPEFDTVPEPSEPYKEEGGFAIGTGILPPRAPWQPDPVALEPITAPVAPEPRTDLGTVALKLEILANGKIIVPGCEPTSSLSSAALSSWMAAGGCGNAVVDLEDVLSAIPGSYVQLGANFGRGNKRQR